MSSTTHRHQNKTSSSIKQFQKIQNKVTVAIINFIQYCKSLSLCHPNKNKSVSSIHGFFFFSKKIPAQLQYMPHTWKCVPSLHDIDSCSCLELVINSPYQYRKIQNDMKTLHLQSTVPILQSNPFGQVPASIPTPPKAMWYLVLHC